VIANLDGLVDFIASRHDDEQIDVAVAFPVAYEPNNITVTGSNRWTMTSTTAWIADRETNFG
jgi:hypothetical protein